MSANELISVLFYLISQDRPLASLKRERKSERGNSCYIKSNSTLLMATANSRVARTLSRLKACANRSLTAAGRQQGGKGGERLIWSCPGEPTSQPSQISLSPPLYSKHLMIINMLQMLKERWESLSYSRSLSPSLARWSARGNHYANEPAAAVFISYNHPHLRGDLQGRAVVHTHNRSELYKYFPFFSPHFFSKEEQRRLCVYKRPCVCAGES